VTNIISWGDAAAFVQPPVQHHNDFAGPVIIDELKVPDVPMLLHQLEKLNDDLRGRPQEDLPLAALLGIVHGLKRIVQYGDADHLVEWPRAVDRTLLKRETLWSASYFNECVLSPAVLPQPCRAPAPAATRTRSHDGTRRVMVSAQETLNTRASTAHMVAWIVIHRYCPLAFVASTAAGLEYVVLACVWQHGANEFGLVRLL
jgi:hypothetical protein